MDGFHGTAFQKSRVLIYLSPAIEINQCQGRPHLRPNELSIFSVKDSMLLGVLTDGRIVLIRGAEVVSNPLATVIPFSLVDIHVNSLPTVIHFFSVSGVLKRDPIA
jgi:hypothetical protein